MAGQEFCSFEDFTEHVKHWEETNFVTLYTRSSRSIEAVKRRAPNRTFADKLKFSELDDEVESECTDEFESDTRIKVPPPPTLPSRVTEESISSLQV